VVVSVGDLDARQTIALQRYPVFPVMALSGLLHLHIRRGFLLRAIGVPFVTD
jgi:hypothetical protein